MTKRTGKPPRNPVAPCLALAAFTTLGAAGVSILVGLDPVIGWTAKPLLLLCMILVIVYTAWSLHIGWIAMIGHLGQVHHFERRREPVWFGLLVVSYLGFAGPTAWYLMTRLVA